MSDTYSDLLEATIQHLESLKARGTKFVSVSDETLAALDRPAIKRASPSPGARLQTSDFRETSGPKLQPTTQALSVSPPPAPSVSTPAMSPDNAVKEAAFADLRRRALACVKCPHLASSRKNVVFGVGSIDAELMFVGEAPGADEDIKAEPFVGRAGQLLTKIIETMGLKRESVYIANILKCRPDTPGQALEIENRRLRKWRRASHFCMNRSI